MPTIQGSITGNGNKYKGTFIAVLCQLTACDLGK